MNTGDLIREYRNIRGMSQKDLAKKSRMSITTLQNYEYGKRAPTIKSLQNIAQALEISPQRLTEENPYNSISHMCELLKEDINIADYKLTAYSKQKEELMREAKISSAPQELEEEILVLNQHINSLKKHKDALFVKLYSKQFEKEDLNENKRKELEGKENREDSSKNKRLDLFSTAFSALNQTGQKKACDYIEDLTKIPEYQKKDDAED